MVLNAIKILQFEVSFDKFNETKIEFSFFFRLFHFMTQLWNTIVYVFMYDLREVIQCMYEVNNGKGFLCIS